jgi:hypothetical protein
MRLAYIAAYSSTTLCIYPERERASYNGREVQPSIVSWNEPSLRLDLSSGQKGREREQSEYADTHLRSGVKHAILVLENSLYDGEKSKEADGNAVCACRRLLWPCAEISLDAPVLEY